MSFTGIKITAARRTGWLLLFLVALALLLCSCHNDLIYLYDDTEEQTEDDGLVSVPFTYEDNGDRWDNVKWISSNVAGTNIAVYNNELYFIGKINGVGKYGFTLYRYNPETGNTTSVCPDPACGHDTYDCPFYSIDNGYEFYIENDIVYYRQHYTYNEDSGSDSSDEIMGYSMYDMKTGKYKWLRDGTNSYIANLVVYNGVCYYVDLAHNEETGEWTQTFCSQDTKTGKITEYEDVCMPIMAFDGILLLYDQSSGEELMRDLETGETKKNRLEGPYYKAYDYFICRSSDGIKKMRLDGSGVVELGADKVDYFYVTDNYIYYTVPAKAFSINVPGGGDIYHGPDKKTPKPAVVETVSIWRMKHDGSEKTEIWTPDTEGKDSFILPGDFVVLGGYIYASYDYYKRDAEYDVWDIEYCPHNFLRIDIDEGGIYYINPAKD